MFVRCWSQSPQGGAKVRTYASLSKEDRKFVVSIPSRRGKGSDKTINYRREVARLVSIPSRRGKGSDYTNTSLTTNPPARLNPLKAGQRFGQWLNLYNLKHIGRLNPLKAGQRFGRLFSIARFFRNGVSIPSRRGKGSDVKRNRELGVLNTRLNPLKAGQRFGREGPEGTFDVTG